MAVDIKILFWNIRDNDDTAIGKILLDLIEVEKPNIVLLAESNVSDKYLQDNTKLILIDGVTKKSFGLNKHLKLYADKAGYDIASVTPYGDGEMLAFGIDVSGVSYLMFACHFASKSSLKDDDKRIRRYAKYKDFVNTSERDYQYPPLGNPKKFKGSFLVGDFNINPFEKPINHVDGLFAIDLRITAVKKLKKLNYFLNPMLSTLGNYGYRNSGKPSAPGTFFYSNKDIEIPSEYFWNMMDGMFFRPSLLDCYEKGQPLEIITEITDAKGTIVHEFFSFSKKEINNEISDHLPIKFTLKL